MNSVQTVITIITFSFKVASLIWIKLYNVRQFVYNMFLKPNIASRLNQFNNDHDHTPITNHETLKWHYLNLLISNLKNRIKNVTLKFKNGKIK